MPGWVDRIARKLADLKAADPTFRAFGAYMHQYRLGPTLTDAALRKVERYYAIELPADYRSFLTTIGNGGAGPGYGLERLGIPAMLPKTRPRPILVSVQHSSQGPVYPVKQFARRFRSMYWNGVRRLAKDRKCLARPFPLRKMVNRSDLKVPRAEAEYETWERTVWRQFDDGLLELAGYGCGMIAKLVVTGQRRGTVWVADECDGEWVAEFRDRGNAVGRVAPEARPYSFARWYEFWLDTALAER